MKGRKLEFTRSEKEEIRRLYLEDNLTVKQVGKHFGVSFTGMRNMMLEMKLPLRDAHRKWTLNPHVFDQIDNEHAAYWHGFIYADGCVSVPKSALQVILSIKDAHHLQKLCDFMQTDMRPREKFYISSKSPNGRIQTSFADAHLARRLLQTGIIVGRNTIDRVIDNVPESLIHHWIRGLFDGDGSADTNQKVICFCGEQSLMTFVRDHLATHAGRNPDSSVFKHKTANLYYVRYKGSANAGAVVDYMYKDATVWLERKLEKIRGWPKPTPRGLHKKYCLPDVEATGN